MINNISRLGHNLDTQLIANVISFRGVCSNSHDIDSQLKKNGSNFFSGMYLFIFLIFCMISSPLCIKS